MKDRAFADFLLGALACVSVFGFYVILHDADAEYVERRRQAAARWALPRKRRRRRTPEDLCRHCGGSGSCDACGDIECRVCHGNGLQPRDESLVTRLSLMWDGSS